MMPPGADISFYTKISEDTFNLPFSLFGSLGIKLTKIEKKQAPYHSKNMCNDT